jgi:hypothetical protein
VIIRRFSVVALVVVGLVAGATTCASAATVSPSTWAPRFCTALEDYQTTISDKSDQMTTALEGVTDLSEGRAQVVSFLSEMVTAAKAAKRAIARAGSPSTPNGGKIEALFVKALDASAGIFSDAKAQAAKISVKSKAAFAKEGKQVGVDLQDAGDRIGKSFGGVGKLDTGKKLETAIKATPECAFLT